jgi:ABC-type branched-subunit amino acid transport system ATPase component
VTTEPLLRVEDLAVAYGAAYVLRGVTFAVHSGASLAVLGRNGAGKTTLMRTLMGLLPASSGSVYFDGQPVTRLAPHHRANLGFGYVPQGRQLFPRLTVEENLIVGAKSARKSRAVGLTDVYEIFPKLAERRRQISGSLSGGEQQMVAVGRAIMSSPRLLLLDEPSEGLAPVIVDQMVDDVADAAERLGFAFIIVEQNVDAALRAAEDAVVMDQGRIVLGHPSEQLRHDPRLAEVLSV